MTTTQYIGSRYVPVFADPMEWSNAKSYEPLTIVTSQGNSYTSKQFVPVGVELNNEDYWAQTGNYNAQVEQYRRETMTVANALPVANFNDITVKNYIDNVANALPVANFNDITVKDYIDGQVEQSRRETMTVANALPVANFNDITVKDYIDKRAFCFETVSEMQHYNHLYAGAICHTNGFYTSNDGGAAWYVITSSDDANGMDKIQCNEFVANIIKTNVLKPEMIGCKSDGISSAAAYITRALQISKHILLTGTYIIDTTLYLTLSGHIIEGPSTLFFTKSSHHEWACVISGNNSLINNVTFEGAQPDMGRTYTKIAIDSADNIEIRSCTFKSENTYTLGLDAYNNWHNIKVINCNFKYNSYFDGEYHPGGFWVRSGYESLSTPANSDNFMVDSCIFEGATSDELFAIYAAIGYLTSNVQVSNCIFHYHDGNAAVPFLRASRTAEKQLFNNCIFICDSNTSTGSLCNINTDSDVFFSDCYFKTNNSACTRFSSGGNFNNCKFFIDSFAIDHAVVNSCQIKAANGSITTDTVIRNSTIEIEAIPTAQFIRSNVEVYNSYIKIGSGTVINTLNDSATFISLNSRYDVPNFTLRGVMTIVGNVIKSPSMNWLNIKDNSLFANNIYSTRASLPSSETVTYTDNNNIVGMQ